MLRLVLPKGSLERATLDLFAAADLGVTRSSEVDYRAAIDDPRVAEVRILRPQEIPLYVADGLFDVGVTGRDWVEERGSAVTSLGVLQYSKATANPIRVVLAVPTDSAVTSVADLAHAGTGTAGAVRVSTEYPELTGRYLEGHGVKAEVSLSYGATEAKVPDIADCVVEITETGRALRAAGLKIVETLLVSHTELIANPAAAEDRDKRHAMEQLLTLLQGALEARGKVLVKLNVPAEQLPGVIEVLPTLRSPTVSELFGDGGFAVETVVPKSEINVLIPALKDRGATDIIELALSKIVH
jgi:ATP phosphoribosyltransferase